MSGGSLRELGHARRLNKVLLRRAIPPDNDGLVDDLHLLNGVLHPWVRCHLRDHRRLMSLLSEIIFG